MRLELIESVDVILTSWDYMSESVSREKDGWLSLLGNTGVDEVEKSSSEETSVDENTADILVTEEVLFIGVIGGVSGVDAPNEESDIEGQEDKEKFETPVQYLLKKMVWLEYVLFLPKERYFHQKLLGY